MEFEIIEFYPREEIDKQRAVGTLHIHILSLGIEIRGINVFVRKNNIMIVMPKGRYFHEESKTIRYYPIFSMLDKDAYYTFMGKFSTAAKKYVREKLGIEEKIIDQNVKEV